MAERWVAQPWIVLMQAFTVSAMLKIWKEISLGKIFQGEMKR
jgi:hypothetical protein